MPLSKIKQEHLSTFIAFNGGGRKLLGERDDIDVLAIMAHESRNQNLIKLFEVLPPLAELKKARLEGELKKTAAAPEVKEEPKADDPKDLKADQKKDSSKKNHTN